MNKVLCLTHSFQCILGLSPRNTEVEMTQLEHPPKAPGSHTAGLLASSRCCQLWLQYSNTNVSEADGNCQAKNPRGTLWEN